LPLTISAQYGLIDQNEFFDKRIASKDVRGYYLIKKGEFAYNKSTSVDAPFGAIKRLDKYNKGVLSTLYILFKIIDDTNTSSDYLVTYYSTDLWHKGIQLIAAEGARNHGLLNITPNDFFKTMLSIPLNVFEQQKIGNFFKSLDHLITLHQSKPFGHILKVIASYTLYWEQRKLGEIVVIERGGSPRPIEKYITELNDGLNWIKIGDAPTQGRYITKTSEKIKESGLSKTRQVFPGDLILSNSMSFGKPYIMEIEGCIHDGWLLIRDKNNVFDLKFLCHMLSTEYLLNQYKMFAAGSTVNNLNKELVGNASVRFPEMLEQKKIGELFQILDHLITLHQLEPFKLIFKAIAYRIIDYAKSKPPRYIKYADLN